MSEWKTAEHALRYLERADQIGPRASGEATLLEELPATIKRVLDLGAGDGRLLNLVLLARPAARGTALDFSDPMLERLKDRYGSESRVKVINHDLGNPLPDLGRFDAVVSSFAIHHLDHERKRRLYQEIWSILESGGVFFNLEHVASPTARLHLRFLEAIGYTSETEDPSNKLLDVETQLRWLREIGFADVDCYWKWRELALLGGIKAAATVSGAER